MKRHKYIINCDSNTIQNYYEFFQWLKDNGYVEEEYEYNVIKGKGAEKTQVCAVLYGKEYGNSFMSIVTHRRLRYRSTYSRGGRCKHNYTYVHIVYRLTPEGAQYIKELIVTDRV